MGCSTMDTRSGVLREISPMNKRTVNPVLQKSTHISGGKGGGGGEGKRVGEDRLNLPEKPHTR